VRAEGKIPAEKLRKTNRRRGSAAQDLARNEEYCLRDVLANRYIALQENGFAIESP
jgi:hypothetical protein